MQAKNHTVLGELPDIIEAAERDAERAIAAARSGTNPTPPIPETRALIHADNLLVLAALAVQGTSIDLIYVDPPFASGVDYQSVARGGADAGGGFRDRWDEGLAGYLSMLAPRLMLMRRVLAETGSIYVHVDWHASHWVRVLLDEIFGPAAFCNEIVWLYGLGGSSPRRWPRKHDTIFWYAARPGHQWFEPVMVPATSARMRGQLKKAPDYWDIPSLNNQALERTGYPTQKPETLLERVVGSSCPPGGLVADFFAGSGTTAAVAERLGRRWIAADLGAASIATTAARLGVDPIEW